MSKSSWISCGMVLAQVFFRNFEEISKKSAPKTFHDGIFRASREKFSPSREKFSPEAKIFRDLAKNFGTCRKIFASGENFSASAEIFSVTAEKISAKPKYFSPLAKIFRRSRKIFRRSRATRDFVALRATSSRYARLRRALGAVLRPLVLRTV